jgi:hypothetical protein
VSLSIYTSIGNAPEMGHVLEKGPLENAKKDSVVQSYGPFLRALMVEWSFAMHGRARFRGEKRTSGKPDRAGHGWRQDGYCWRRAAGANAFAPCDRMMRVAEQWCSNRDVLRIGDCQRGRSSIAEQMWVQRFTEGCFGALPSAP